MRHPVSRVHAASAVAVFIAGVVLCAGVAAAPRRQLPINPLQGAAQPQPLPKGSALMLGQVIDGSSDQPVPGAVVRLTMRPAPPPRGGGQGASPAAPGRPGGPLVMYSPIIVIADDQGHFVFHDLPAGSATISATASGYTNGAAGQTRPTGSGRPIDLAEGDRLKEVKVKMWKFGVLTGSVLDEAGEPAIGVQVRALRKVNGPARVPFDTAGQVSTDDRGVFRISGLVPGDYLVLIPQTTATIPASLADTMVKGVVNGGGMGPGMLDAIGSGAPVPNGQGVRVGDYLLQSSAAGPGPAPLPPGRDGRMYVYQTQFFPAAYSSSQATVIALKSGEERGGLNMQMRIVPAARISGTVTGPDGPMANIGVKLAPGGDEPESGVDVAVATTNTDGTFMMMGVPPGQFVLRVLKPPRLQLPPELASNGLIAMAFGPNAGAAPTGSAALTLFAQTTLSITGADVSGVSLSLNEGSKVSGRIEFDGAAQRPTPQQMAQMNVILYSADGRSISAGPRPGQPMTDDQGRFKTGGYAPGKYLAIVNGPVPAGWMLKGALTGGRDVTIQPLEIRDADVNDLVITFTDKIAQVSGSARASSGGAPPTATVFIMPEDFKAWMANGMPQRQTRSVAVAPKTGAFTVPSVLPGSYLIAAIDDRDMSDNQDLAFLTAVSRVATHVTIAEGDKKTQDLTIVRVVR